ncbi:hypothetical protein [Anthocerotibacter panamensis]|uniref:hypothetical protein n=1 Tax=Anthocerotibacter panamensis TaxID=2857077 RepID=UPI001C4034CA|nr:hypothetical protein [Anthocerotibacter panamensis]
MRFALLMALLVSPVLAQTKEETVEEVARLETFDYARSPLDNRRLTLGEYARLQGELQAPPPPKLSAKLKELILLLRIRKLIKSLVPFAPL